MMRGLTQILLILGCLIISGTVQACEFEAKTDLETVFCQVKRAGGAPGLTSLHEFRKNPAKTQRLLLLRPAKKFGISLPEIEKKVTRQEGVAKASKKRSVTQNSELFTLVDCQLSGESIQCGREHYALQHNRQTALKSNRTLECGPAPGSADMFVVKRYVQRCYEEYVMAMLDLGLADVTMSYTKFHHFFDESIKQSIDFSSRLNTMFEFLKKDAGTMPKSSRQKITYPANIEACQSLNSSIILCDNVSVNWVYLKSP